jgi:hypothetical protein
MCADYLVSRAFAKGISASYTRLRDEDTVPQQRGLRAQLSAIKTSVMSRLRAGQETAERINARISAAYREGFVYHQAETHRDLVLLDWVLRDDYLDYRLPPGWEKHFAKAA